MSSAVFRLESSLFKNVAEAHCAVVCRSAQAFNDCVKMAAAETFCNGIPFTDSACSCGICCERVFDAFVFQIFANLSRNAEGRFLTGRHNFLAVFTAFNIEDNSYR